MRGTRASLDASRGNRAAHSQGRLGVIFAPILALLAATAVLAMAGWAFGWYQVEMYRAAEILAGIAGVLAMVLLYRQIRQRQAANRALQSMSARVGNIVEAAMDPIITVDERQHIVVFNAAAERVFRWPRDAVLGQPLDKLLPQRFREGHREHIEHFGTTGTTSRRMGTQMVLMALRADGGEFPIEASISQHSEEGKRLYTVILRDITERVDAETQLARSEARLRGILDSAMDAIITVDATQHIVLFNAAAEAMFGCPRDEAIGAPLAWFIPQRFRDAHANHVRHFGETGIASRRMGAQRIVTGLRRNGEEFPIDAAISQLAEHDTKFYTVILRDITERLRAEDVLRRSKEELKELGAAANVAREHEKSRVARELHDELGQSLTALQMDVAWCKENIPPGEQALARKLDRMQAMLDATVAATRRIAADLRPLMLDDLGLLPAVEWLVEDFSQRSGVACELEVSDPDLDLALPDAYATAVYRSIQESLTNVTKHARASRVEVAIGESDGMLTVRVCDNGAGFSADDPRKPNSYGLLGLRERAALLGGDATISSAPGAGTRIEIRLPVEPRPAAS
jgi:PAS domain S-box-containing protein